MGDADVMDDDADVMDDADVLRRGNLELQGECTAWMLFL